MKILSVSDIAFVQGGQGENIQLSVFGVGHNYVAPDGSIQFLANYIQYEDGSQYYLGCIPEGYQLVSNEIVIKPLYN